MVIHFSNIKKIERYLTMIIVINKIINEVIHIKEWNDERSKNF